MNNDPNTNPELAKAMKVAELKFGLIAPVLQGTHIGVSAAAYYKRVTAEKLTSPDGKTVKLSYKTLEKWTSEYKRFGFDALIPRGRSDCGTSRALTDAATERIYTLKQMFPRRGKDQCRFRAALHPPSRSERRLYTSHQRQEKHLKKTPSANSGRQIRNIFRRLRKTGKQGRYTASESWMTTPGWN